MGALGRFVESGGIATTGISLVREHSERMRPPRALWVPYPLGRPFGVPGDAAFQSAVLRSVLALLEAPSGPVLADYPVELPDASREAEESMPWACPIPLAPAPTGAEPPLAQAFEEELARLLPWYALAVERRGRTTVGLAGLDPRALGAFLAGLLDAPLSLPASEGLAEQLKHAVEDLKALFTAKPRPTSWAERRQRMDEICAIDPPPDDVAFSPTTIGAMQAEWSLAPGGDARRVLLYFHGGGYCSGSITSHRGMVGRVGRDAAIRTLAIAYRLAPELNSFSGRPRILVVHRNSPESRPLLVVQAEGSPAKLDAFGPMMSEPVGARIATDVKRWAAGGKGC